MKKVITMIALAFAGTSVFAQDLTSKKGEPILPEAEDWSIGVDATPFLDYLGNFFGKSSSNNAPTFNQATVNQMITGKYFVDAQTAYRASLRIGFGSVTQRSMVADRTFSTAAIPNTFPNQNPMVENKWVRSSNNIGLAVGIEKRRGKTRLQGFYGAELGFNLSGSRDKFTYGNALSSSTVTPVDVDADDQFSPANNIMTNHNVPGVPGDARVIDRKNGSTFTFGVRGFIGVEYFLLPKISLGGEFGWGLGMSSTGATSTDIEMIGDNGDPASTPAPGSTTIEGAKRGSFGLDTDNANSLFGPTAQLRLNFHF